VFTNVTIHPTSNLEDVNFSGSVMDNFNIKGSNLGRSEFADVLARDDCNFKNISFKVGKREYDGPYKRASSTVKALIERDNPEMVKGFKEPAREK